MRFQGAEDRLNPATPEGASDTTLGGYQSVHGRAAAFQGCDGRPYTAAIETEQLSGSGTWAGYLVFLKWADTGTAIMGHIETGDLVTAASEQEAHDALSALPLARIKEILDNEIGRIQRST